MVQPKISFWPHSEAQLVALPKLHATSLIAPATCYARLCTNPFSPEVSDLQHPIANSMLSHYHSNCLSMSLRQPMPLSMLIHPEYVAVAIRAAEEEHGLLGKSVFERHKPLASKFPHCSQVPQREQRALLPCWYVRPQFPFGC